MLPRPPLRPLVALLLATTAATACTVRPVRRAVPSAHEHAEAPAPASAVPMPVAPAPAPRVAAEEPATPEWIVEQFFARPAFAARERHVAPALLARLGGDTPGAGLPPTVRVSWHPLDRHDDHAVYAVRARDARQALDWYAWLGRGDGGRGAWRLEAMTSFVLSPAFYAAVDSLGAAPALPDSVRRDLARMRLVAGPDSALVLHFAAVRPALDSLAARLADLPLLQAITDRGRANPDRARPREGTRQVTADMARAGVGIAYRTPLVPGCLLFKIGGEGALEAGFLHAPDGCRVPAMTPDGFMYVERVGAGWYVYRKA